MTGCRANLCDRCVAIYPLNCNAACDGLVGTSRIIERYNSSGIASETVERHFAGLRCAFGAPQGANPPQAPDETAPGVVQRAKTLKSGYIFAIST